MERTDIITLHGNPLTLVGTPVAVGDTAPPFTALDRNFAPVTLADHIGSPIIISAVPSIDTPVCELQTKRFNEEAAKLPVKVFTISMDLPFAHARFCDSFNINNLTSLSDFRDRSFANAYGLSIKETGLVARAVIVIDPKGKITHLEIVRDISQHPDYDRAIAEAKKIV